MSLADHIREQIWAEHVYSLAEIVSEKQARSMVGWAGKNGYTCTQIMNAIGNLKNRKPGAKQAWAYWRAALGKRLPDIMRGP